jgi:protoporphyrinogen oxidase
MMPRDSSSSASTKTAIIIGAGPAGLTAAYELITRTDIKPVVLEKSGEIGGISRTVNYKGNRIDIGGHRFFSKSERVMNWWQNILPMQKLNGSHVKLGYHAMQTDIKPPSNGPDPEHDDLVLLVRSRRSRIYFLRKFFDYPISLSADTLRKLGLLRTIRIGFSYVRSALFPIRHERSLEEFFINRFGRELYSTFFKSYTEKVWGVPCTEISAEWGAQRIKGLSIIKTLTHAVKKLWRPPADVAQKNVETSLIEQFLYPKFGPGQMWEEVARRVVAGGGQIVMNVDVDRLEVSDRLVTAVQVVDAAARRTRFQGDYVFSTMPVKDLCRALDGQIPSDIKEISEGLMYRDFITVGLLLKEMKVREDTPSGRQLIRDNWVYIQEPDVSVGRMQVFNNWSPYMVADPTTTWIGLEYFCYETDALWRLPDDEMIRLATAELAKIGVIDQEAVLDATVIRVPKTYPAYFGSYGRFDELRRHLDTYPNLFLIGRNGMHKYNNQDHSMLTAMVTVDNIIAGTLDKESIWAVNTEQEYHESK